MAANTSSDNEASPLPSSSSTPSQSSSLSITPAQRERIEKNRQRALELKRSRVPQATTSLQQAVTPRARGGVQQEDTRGGFILDEEEEEEHRPTKIKKIIYDEAPAVGDDQLVCVECSKRFPLSFLWSKFRESVCDDCRDPDGKHTLITKTEAKERFLLKDCDFNERGGPPLLFIVRKNPHSSRGDMKLYMASQVESRSHDLWGGEEGLEKERERREEAKEKKKQNKYSKQVKELRRTVYSSSSSLRRYKPHTHTYSSEIYDESRDEWTKTCKDCGHSVTFQKL